MKKKYYAVRVGRKTGIFTSWEECKEQVMGTHAVYKSFSTLEEAEAFMSVTEETVSSKKDASQEEVCKELFARFPNRLLAFTDGSFDAKSGAYGYGCVLIYPDGHITEHCGSGTENTESRNIAGELAAVLFATEKAVEMNMSITVFHDYTGIAHWARGEWKANLPLTSSYAEKMKDLSKKVSVEFCKVAAHTGNYFNERADALAKSAIGLDK